MLGLLLLYFIGKYFAELAEKYYKNKWLYAILGIVVYYATTFLFGLLLGVIQLLTGTDLVSGVPDIVLGLIALPFGLGGCWLTHFILKRIWEKKALAEEPEILDQF